MKKMIVMSLVMMMTLAMAVPAMAAEDQTKGMTVTYGVSDGFEMTIPADLEFTKSDLSFNKNVVISNAILAGGQALTVTVESENGYNMVYDTDSKIAYTVTPDGGSAFSGSDAQIVLTVNAGTTDASKALTFATTANAIDGATKAGTHTDTLTFTATVQ